MVRCTGSANTATHHSQYQIPLRDSLVKVAPYVRPVAGGCVIEPHACSAEVLDTGQRGLVSAAEASRTVTQSYFIDELVSSCQGALILY